MSDRNFTLGYKEPFSLFELWLADAETTEPNDANAMALSTADKEGKVSVRIMLLKAVDAKGFVFYTNFDSQKGQDLLSNPNAGLCFYWKSMRRQVRVTGKVEQVSNEEADAYFASRPRGSQIGAWASEQSRPLNSRADLEERIIKLENEYEDRDVPRPAHWSGFRLIPDEVEFWQAGEYRLHDRFIFTIDRDDWVISRLNP